METVTGIPAVQERIFTTNLGTLLLLKTCGFVEEYRGRIIEVTENRLRVRIGGSALQRLFSRFPLEKAVEVDLQIHHEVTTNLTEEDRSRLPGIACSQVDITIRPGTRSWTKADFQTYSRRMLWTLRKHFVAP